MRRSAMFIFISLLLCIAILQGCTDSTNKELVTGDVIFEDFDYTTLPNHWTITNRNDIFWSLTTNPGFLTIITQPADVHETANNPVNFFLREIPYENYQFTARIEIFPERDFEQAGILIWENEDNYIRLGRVHAFDAQAIEAAVEVATAYTTVIENIDPITEVYLRLINLNNQVSYYYSANGEEWIEVGNRTWVNYSKPIIGLYAISPVSDRAIEAKFDYIQVEELKWEAVE